VFARHVDRLLAPHVGLEQTVDAVENQLAFSAADDVQRVGEGSAGDAVRVFGVGRRVGSNLCRRDLNQEPSWGHQGSSRCQRSSSSGELRTRESELPDASLRGSGACSLDRARLGSSSDRGWLAVDAAGRNAPCRLNG
jgi:hypothetical protein